MADYINKYDLKAAFEEDGHLSAYVEEMIDSVPAADVVPGTDFRDCRNELCLKCGNYQKSYVGACSGCRWSKGRWESEKTYTSV